MPVDILWVTVGFVVGVAATALALEVAFKRVRNGEGASLTRNWDLDRLGADGPPGVVATAVDGVAIPKGARVLVPPGAQLSRQILGSCELRLHPDAKGNFAVGGGRAVVCTGPMTRGTLALAIVHPNIVSQLSRSFEALWMQGRPYTQKVEPSDIAGNRGNTVEVEGTVVDALTTGDRVLLTVTGLDGERKGTVVVPTKLPIETGKSYRFTGTVVTEGTRVAVRADKVTPLVDA